MDDKTREKVLELIGKLDKENSNIKISHIEKVTWNNWITKGKQLVKDIFFLGYNTSDKPWCITKIIYNGESYVIHEYLTHVNLNSSVYNRDFLVDGKTMSIYYQSFCNPITGYHMFNTPNIDKILKGQLMGQNNDSPFQNPEHVVNSGIDFVITNRASGRYIKRNAHPVELTSRYEIDEIKDGGYTVERLKKDEIFVKRKTSKEYERMKIKKYETYDKSQLSEYYLPITYEVLEDASKNLPKKEIDFTVVGLGSAGTGILDQVSRSTYFKNYLLIDFDTVEAKNLRNQWYQKRHIGTTKANASFNIMKNAVRRDSDNMVLIKETTFENVPLNNFVSKYVVSGFDNLKCRLELLDKTLDGFDVKYLIDLRYLDYACSIYFVDLENEKEVKYYRALLEADKEIFEKREVEKKYIETKEELMEYWADKNLFYQGCGGERYRLCMKSGCPTECGSKECKNYLWKRYQECPKKIEIKEESSCIRENFIDIYKYASSFVFAAIREIEAGNAKPFTHIEAQTEVIPTSMIIRK